MKNIYKIVMIFAAAIALSSCGSTSIVRSSDAISFKPTEVRLDLEMTDFVLLGDVEVSIDKRTYLGVFTSIDKVNGEEYNRREKERLRVSNLRFAYEGTLSKALYKITEKYPDADYILPVYSSQKKNQLFLGSITTTNAKFKVYKFKK
ncbi:MAG: hypothetical protein SNH88_03210 [Rikenellaceae bacterium]